MTTALDPMKLASLAREHGGIRSGSFDAVKQWTFTEDGLASLVRSLVEGQPAGASRFEGLATRIYENKSKTDPSVTQEFLAWLDTVRHRNGVGANEAWNAGVAWARAVAAAPVPPAQVAGAAIPTVTWKPACVVCGKPWEQHGTYPTCATHPYSGDGLCGAVGTFTTGSGFVGLPCHGAQCVNGCARAPISKTTGRRP